MALVREQMVMYDGGFVDAEESAFDALGYAGGHDALLGGADASALFDFGGYGYGQHEPARPYLPNSASWAGAGPSVLTFGRGGQVAVVAEEEADCDAWIDAMEDDQAAPASSTIGFDPASGCFSLTQRSDGARRPFGLLFPSTPSGTGSSDAAAPAPAPARVSTQKRPYAVRMKQGTEPRAAKRQCVASRKTSKPKPPATTTTPPKDPQSLAAKVIEFC
jgi:hypothetical protein